MKKITNSTTLPFLLACTIAIASGIIEMRQTNLLITTIFILSGGLVIGVLWWKRSWRYGLIIGLGVPIAYLLEPIFGYHLETHAQPNALVSFAALLPGVTGAATGTMLRIAYDEGKAKRNNA